MKNISILGVTGSIGEQALDVIRRDSENFSLVGISANTSYDKVFNIIHEFNPKYAAITEKNTYNKLMEYAKINNLKTEILYGLDGLNIVASSEETDILLTSVVGMVGLIPTITAIKAGKDIALANKETLVVGGEIVMREAAKNKINILPVDSEHGAIFQCLQGNNISDLRRIILTASGGPFRGKKYDDLKSVTSSDALKHPKWNMGKKISIDSSTLMNKGLEVIEAHWLFNSPYEKIEVVVHPQSIIHSMVEYKDGSIIAQLGSTDMRLPIQYALNYPVRKKKVVDSLDFSMISSLTFEKPDFETFKCLKLAFEAGKIGGTMPAILNAANEVAVELFLNNEIKFLQIGDIIEECMCKFSYKNQFIVDDVLQTDEAVRRFVREKYMV